MKLVVTICQYDMAWCDAEANLARLDRMLRDVDTDLIVLPEMFQTGFAVDADGVAEETDGPSIEAMRRWASRCDAAVAGSIAVREGGRLFNRLLFVEPSGRIAFYDKRHLFSVGGEDRRFTAGADRTIVEWRGVRFLLMVCYDLRFPVWSRNCADYDAAIYCALWPGSRRKAWNTLLAARAIENQAYVIGVNRVGDEPSLSYAGDSRIVDFRGDDLVSAGDGQGLFSAAIDTDALAAYRRKFAVWRDADRFDIS